MLLLNFVFLFLALQPHADAQETTLQFQTLLSAYSEKSPRALEANQALQRAENLYDQDTDQWQSRLTATPQIDYFERKFEASSGQNVGYRAKNITGNFTQQFPTGTKLELNGQKFIEAQNPLFSSVDRKYSAKITQELFKNSFGASQKAQMKGAEQTFNAALLQFRQESVAACQEAYELYTNTYIQQETLEIRKQQMRDAEQAWRISKRLHQDRIINDIDKLSAESDYLNTQIQLEEAEQLFTNNVRQINAYLDQQDLKLHQFTSPDKFIHFLALDLNGPTLSELITQSKLEAQEFQIDRNRSDRRTDMSLGLEAGETFGRFGFNGPLLAYNENYMILSLTLGFDFIHNTEDSNLKTAINIKNSLAQQRDTLGKTQVSRIQNLRATDALLTRQLKTNQKQARLLEQKMKAAFAQMQRARLDFENYLLHRNAFLDRKINNLNLQKDLWLNQFALAQEYAHQNKMFCQGNS